MPLFWISLAFLCGILISANLAIPILGWSGLACLALIATVAPITRRLFTRFHFRNTWLEASLRISSPTILPLMILFLSLGAIDYQIARPKIDTDHIAYYNDQAAENTVEAVIIEPPDRRDTYINLRLDSQLLYSEEEAKFIPVKGLILARVSTSTSFSYGDRIQLQGHIVTPPENDEFSYRDYLAHQRIYSYVAFPTTSVIQRGHGNSILAAVYAFRQNALDLVYSIYPDPEASLIAGILLGVQSGIPQNVQEAFRLTGTSHIIVISGFNITIVAWFFYELFRRLLGKRKGAVVAAVGIIFYTLLVGANPAVLRAAFLGILTLLGRQLGRRQSGINSLAFAAAFLAIFDPHILWDVSFQLSFAATLGIMIYAEPLTQWFIKKAGRFLPAEKAERLAGPVGEYFLLTLAAQLTTLPLMIYYFKRLSLTALIANPLVLPAQPALMVLGGSSILLGVIFKPLGQLLALAAWPFTAYTIRVVEWLADIPHGSIVLSQIALPLIIIFYIVLFTFTFTRQSLPRLVARFTPAFPLTLMAIITVFTWKTAFYSPDGRLHATILDVGTGEALLIQSPSGRMLLVNGGASSTRLSESLGRRLPPFNRSLDWLVIAGIDNEDLSALPTNLERFKPTNTLWAGNTSGSRSAIELSSTLIADGIPITQIQVGHALDLGSGALLKVQAVNERGAVLLLEWHSFRLLLPLGADFAALESIQKDLAMRNISAVLLAESGYAPLNSPEFLSFIHPQLALLSVAPADKTGLPSPETLEALRGYNLLRTDQNGWIEITTDGSQMWVEVEK